MKKANKPQPKYRGNRKSLDRLDTAIQRAIQRDYHLAIEYQNETLNLQIAGLLHQMRTQAGLTQQQFAEMAGFSQPFVARLENPQAKKQPSLETLAKIANAFNKRLIIGLADV